MVRTVVPFATAGTILGYTQTDSSVLLAIAPYFGVFGISFVCVLINSILYRILAQVTSNDYYQTWILCSVMVVMLFVLSALSKQPVVPENTAPLSVAIVQGNHSQVEKLNRSHWNRIVSTYTTLSQPHWSQDIVLWPENLIPRALHDSPKFISLITNSISSENATLITGLTEQKGGRFL